MAALMKLCALMVISSTCLHARSVYSVRKPKTVLVCKEAVLSFTDDDQDFSDDNSRDNEQQNRDPLWVSPTYFPPPQAGQRATADATNFSRAEGRPSVSAGDPSFIGSTVNVHGNTFNVYNNDNTIINPGQPESEIKPEAHPFQVASSNQLDQTTSFSPTDSEATTMGYSESLSTVFLDNVTVASNGEMSSINTSAAVVGNQSSSFHPESEKDLNVASTTTSSSELSRVSGFNQLPTQFESDTSSSANSESSTLASKKKLYDLNANVSNSNSDEGITESTPFSDQSTANSTGGLEFQQGDGLFGKLVKNWTAATFAVETNNDSVRGDNTSTPLSQQNSWNFTEWRSDTDIANVILNSSTIAVNVSDDGSTSATLPFGQSVDSSPASVHLFSGSINITIVDPTGLYNITVVETDGITNVTLREITTPQGQNNTASQVNDGQTASSSAIYTMPENATSAIPTDSTSTSGFDQSVTSTPYVGPLEPNFDNAGNIIDPAAILSHASNADNLEGFEGFPAELVDKTASKTSKTTGKKPVPKPMTKPTLKPGVKPATSKPNPKPGVNPTKKATPKPKPIIKTTPRTGNQSSAKSAIKPVPKPAKTLSKTTTARMATLTTPKPR